MMIEIRLLGPEDAHVLNNVTDDVFDGPVIPEYTADFLADRRHHIVVALDGETVVGMASAVDYIHPDKSPILWINEVGVDEGYRRRGIGRRLMRALFEHGKTLGCKEAWVGTENDNEAARGLYVDVGGGDAEQFVMYEFKLSS